MPSSARIAPGDYVYHVLTRGNNRQAIFQGDEDFEKYMELLLQYKEKYKFKLYHYVLMPNHVHLVLEPTEMGGGLAGLSLASFCAHFWIPRRICLAKGLQNIFFIRKLSDMIKGVTGSMRMIRIRFH